MKQLSLAGGFKTSKKNISMEGLSHILLKIKNVPNHQPVSIYGNLTGSRSHGKSIGFADR